MYMTIEAKFGRCVKLSFYNVEVIVSQPDTRHKDLPALQAVTE